MGYAASISGPLIKFEPQTEIRAVVHEMVNALAPVVSYSKELLSSETDPEKKRRLKAILCSGRTITRLVHALRSDRSMFRPRFEKIKARELLFEALDESKPAASERCVRLDHDLADEVGDARVVADRGLARRLLVNLIFNAVRASPRGSEVIVSLGAEEDRLRYTVKDSGPGLPGGRIDAMSEGYTTRNGEGHGTGLFVCRTIARVHATELKSENRRGGAEISFVLPALGLGPHSTENHIVIPLSCPATT